MRRLLTALVCSSALTAVAFTQTVVSTTVVKAPRDAQAVTVMAAAITKMGSTPPSDSTASGNLQLSAGSRVENGTLTILTRGMSETREQISVPSGQQLFTFADGLSSENLNGAGVARSAEIAASSQSAMFPLPLFASAYVSDDVALSYVGAETLNGAPVTHIRFWYTQGGKSSLQYLAKLSQRDVWLDAVSGLPVRVAYTRRAGSGAVPSVAITLAFGDYRLVNGYLYPFQIKKYVNGTLWATITIQSVAFNTGLTAADFTLQ